MPVSRRRRNASGGAEPGQGESFSVAQLDSSPAMTLGSRFERSSSSREQMDSDFVAVSVDDDTVEGTQAALPGDTSRWQQRDGRVQPSI